MTKKMLLEELAAVKSELATMRSERETVSESTSGSINFRSSENLEPRQQSSLEDESLLATLSHMSLGSLNIPECKPSDGETDVDKMAYEHWKEILAASFSLMGAINERAKMDIFRIKAGPKLLEVMKATSSTPNMPDEQTSPYSNAIARLDHYFGSRNYIIGQRGKLLNMIQHEGESNVVYVRRVAASAKLCGYKSEEEMEAVVRTLLKGASDSRVRVLAQRNWTNEGDINSLITLVRDHEMELFNEEEYQKLNRKNRPSVAAIVQHTDARSHQQRGGPRYRGAQRGRGSFRRAQASFQGTSRRTCWRCASIYHDPSACPSIDKVCHNCKRRGHLARTCSSQPQFGVGQKRALNDRDDEEPKPKIAAITQSGEEDTNKVQDNVDIE